MKPVVLAISGWRGWPWELRRIIWTDLLRVRADLPVGQLLIIRHGHCRRGVDLIADRFAVQDPQCEPQRFPALWRVHGEECGTEHLRDLTKLPRSGAGAWCPGPPAVECGRAGDRRNALLAYTDPRPDVALAYPGPPGKSGTRNAMRHLKEAGVPVTVKTFAEVTGRSAQLPTLTLAADSEHRRHPDRTPKEN